MQYAVSELRGLLDTMDMIEELIQSYESLDKYQRNQDTPIIRFEFMDKYMRSQSSLMIYQYFMNHLDELTPNEQRKIQKISDYYLKDKYAEKFFGKSYNVVQDELKYKWQESLNSNQFEVSFEQDLDRLRLFYSNYFVEKFQLQSPKYKDFLTNMYGEEFVYSCCGQLKKYREKIIRFYQSYLLSQTIPTNASVSDLRITEQQAFYFFNFFLNQFSSLIHSYNVKVEFTQKAKIIKINQKFLINLSPYHSFSVSLFEFLTLLGEVYSKILEKPLKNEQTEESKSYEKQAFSCYATLIPIISIDFSKMIEKFFVGIGSAEEIYNILLKNYLAIRRNPISLSNINIFQLFLIDMIGYELEEKWIDGEITSRELLIKWQELIVEYFGKTSFNEFEITLRIFQHLLEGVGIPLVRIGIILTAFERGMLNDHYDHPFKPLLHHFRNQTLSSFCVDEKFLSPHLIKEENLQYLLLYLTQLYHQVSL